MSCGENSPSKQTESKFDRPTELAEKNEILPGTLFATFDASNGYDAMQNAAKFACDDEEICKVVIFPIGTVLPTNFPMTDREVEQTIGNYTLNRNSSADELLAKCPEVASTPADKCF